MRGHPKADLYRAEREQGYSAMEIANRYGVSHQAVCQACGKWSPGHFKRFSEKSVVFPNLRRWLNDTRMTRAEFIRRLGCVNGGNSNDQLRRLLNGTAQPRKKTIDKMLEITGLTYEEMFSPVETEKRGTARWKKETEGNFYWYVCSHCGGAVPKGSYRQDWFAEFCPTCGWPMEDDG